MCVNVNVMEGVYIYIDTRIHVNADWSSCIRQSQALPTGPDILPQEFSTKGSEVAPGPGSPAIPMQSCAWTWITAVIPLSCAGPRDSAEPGQ